MPATAGQPPGDVARVLGVVEHQQPPAPLPQLAQHRRPHHLDVRPGLDAAQRGAQGGELVPDQPGLLGIDPPGQVIGPGEPVRVLDRQLGLAHPAHALERLHHRLVPGQQPLPHRHQQPVPAGEPGIAGRNIPHPRHTARQPRTRTAQPCSTHPACPGPGTPASDRGASAPHRLQQHRRACSSASPNRSRNTSGRSTGGTCAAGTSSTRTGTSRSSPSPARAPAPPSTPRWYTGTGRSTPPRTAPPPGRTGPAHRSSPSRSSGPRPSPTHPAQRCTRPRLAARPPTPPTPGQHQHD